jgi:CDP-glycerol glycerophosphotransferase (TagB/SpsB family)
MRAQAFGRQTLLRHRQQMMVDPVWRHTAGIKAFERSHGWNQKKPLGSGFSGEEWRN